MYQKIVDNKMVETAAGTQYSSPVSLGSDNSLLYEVWLVSSTALSTNGVTVALQGTNDGQNWTNVSGVSNQTTGVTAPKYISYDTDVVVPFAQVRLSFAATGNNARALMHAAIRTYTRNA